MNTGAKSYTDPLRRKKTIILALSLAASALAVLTFWDWDFLWSWQSPLRYSLALTLAALTLWLSKSWTTLLAAVLSPYVFINLGYDMFQQWREYWVDGFGFRHAIGQALMPIWEPLHVALSIAIFGYAVFHLMRRGSRGRFVLP